jgi:hypothetical protein
MFVMSNYNFELWKRLDREVTDAGFSQDTEVGTAYSKWHPGQRYAKGGFFLAIDMGGINYDAAVALWDYEGREICSAVVSRGSGKILPLTKILPFDRFMHVISMPPEKISMAAENCLNEKALEEL